MIYVSNITTENTYSEANPKNTVLKVTRGLVYRMELLIPNGPAGLLHIGICDGGYKVWPSTQDQWFSGDGETIGFDDVYLKLEPPYEFMIKTWNEDELYSHWCQVRIGLVSERIYMARYVPHYGYEEFRDMIKALTMEQEEAKKAIIAHPFSWIGPEGE